MFTLRHVLAVAAAAATVLSASPAHASGDATGTIRALAADAAQLVAEEQQLVQLTDPRNPSAPTIGLADARLRLRAVDEEGHQVLLQLERLGVDVTEAMRATLQPLPDLDTTGPAELDQFAPRSVVYDAAVIDLMRIATTPETIVSPVRTADSPATGLLAVGAISLLVLGAAALANTLRHRPAQQELAAMAWTDGLTGLANRGRLDQDLATYARSGGRATVAMIEIDHFPSVSDTFGISHANRILREVGEMLARHVRYDDVVYRYGGEAFCILLPDASAEDARNVAERIVVAAHDIAVPGGAHVTLSVGIASADDGTVAAAVTRADEALAEAKLRGRDCVVIATQRTLAPA